MADILAGFEALPQAGIGRILQGRRALILAPHPDDESLGCGGLIAAACAADLAPIVIVLTDGAASHPGSRTFPPNALAALREREAAAATGLLGLPRENLYFFRQPDGRLAAAGEAFETMAVRAEALGRKHGCALVIGPWAGDPHCDHEAAAGLAGSLAERCGWALLCYPVWGWLRDGDDVFDEERSGWRLDISEYRAVKTAAIAAHASQTGAVIADSLHGFRLPEALLAVFARNFEVLLSG